MNKKRGRPPLGAGSAKEPPSFRLSEEMRKRLKRCAEIVKQKPSHIANMAIEAAIEAIEANGGRLVVPIEFKLSVAQVPKPADESNSGTKRAAKDGGTFNYNTPKDTP